MPKYAIRLDPKVVQDKINKIKIQFHQFPGTTSIVAQATLDGYELAIASHQAVSAAWFVQARSEFFAEKRVRPLAADKVWELEEALLRQRIFEQKNGDIVAMNEHHGNVYLIEPMNEPPLYSEPNLPYYS